jgi:hypothetical protein
MTEEIADALYGRPSVPALREWTEESAYLPVCFVVGVDVGQVRDFTAVAVNEVYHGHQKVMQQARFQAEPSEARRQRLSRHHIRFLERLPLSTPYPDMIRRVGEIMDRLPPMERPPALVVDQTGVGRPVLDMMREQRLRPIGVSITAGVHETGDRWDDKGVPKRVLASTLGVAMDAGRLIVSPKLLEADALKRELAAFRVKKLSTGNQTFEAWREGEHDDLVLAVAMAVWGAERIPQPMRTAHINWMAR